MVGHFAFTIGLLPVLLNTAKVTGKEVRVINVSALAHIYAPPDGILFDNINMDGYNAWQKYGQSKLVIYFVPNNQIHFKFYHKTTSIFSWIFSLYAKLYKSREIFYLQMSYPVDTSIKESFLFHCIPVFFHQTCRVMVQDLSSPQS